MLCNIWFSLSSQYPAALMNLGAILHLNGKLQEAEANYLRALQLKPDDTITQSNLRKLWNIMEKQGLRTMAPWLKQTNKKVELRVKDTFSCEVIHVEQFSKNVRLVGLRSKIGTLENLLENCNFNTCKNFSGNSALHRTISTGALKLKWAVGTYLKFLNTLARIGLMVYERPFLVMKKCKIRKEWILCFKT